MRDVLVFRSGGEELGIESFPAMERSMKAAIQHTNCDDSTFSQLKNGWKHIIEEIQQMPSMSRDKRRGRSRSRSRPVKGSAKGSAEDEGTERRMSDTNGPSSSDPVHHPDVFRTRSLPPVRNPIGESHEGRMMQMMEMQMRKIDLLQRTVARFTFPPIADDGDNDTNDRVSQVPVVL